MGWLKPPNGHRGDPTRSDSHAVQMIRNGCEVAYELPPVPDTPRRGRPRKKGNSVKLNTLFQSRTSEFTKAEAMMYGKEERQPWTFWRGKRNRKKRVLKTIETTERFVLCASIAMGLTQMIALTPDFAEAVRTQRYLQTFSKNKVSEATVLDYLRKNIFRLLYLNRY